MTQVTVGSYERYVDDEGQEYATLAEVLETLESEIEGLYFFQTGSWEKPSEPRYPRYARFHGDDEFGHRVAEVAERHGFQISGLSRHWDYAHKPEDRDASTLRLKFIAPVPQDGCYLY